MFQSQVDRAVATIGDGIEDDSEKPVEALADRGARPGCIDPNDIDRARHDADQQVEQGVKIAAIPFEHRTRRERRYGTRASLSMTSAIQIYGHGHRYIRNTPKPRSSTGAFSVAAKASPSTSRVCAGSMMPSSHNRGGCVIGIAFVLILLADRRLEGLRLLGRPFVGVAVDRGQHRRRLFAAHHADPAVGPAEQEARGVGAAAHAVIARAEAAADQHGDLRHGGRGNGRHQLRTMLGDPLGLIFAADHEAADILEEEQGDAPLLRQLDEMRAFAVRFR